MDWSDDAMVAFLDADVCNFVAWSKEEVAERRDQLKEAYDVPSLVRVIKLRLPAFKNNRQKRETLVRKLITLSASDADTLWRLRDTLASPPPAPSTLRQKTVRCGICGEQFHGGRGHQLHTCESCESVEPEAKRSRLEENASERSSESSSNSSSSTSNSSTSSSASKGDAPADTAEKEEGDAPADTAGEEEGDAPADTAEGAVAGEDDDSESSSEEPDLPPRAVAALVPTIPEGAAAVEEDTGETPVGAATGEEDPASCSP